MLEVDKPPCCSSALFVDFEHVLIDFAVQRYLFSVNNKETTVTSDDVVDVVWELSSVLSADFEQVFAFSFGDFTWLANDQSA